MADVAAIISFNGIKRRGCADNFPPTPGVAGHVFCYVSCPNWRLPWPKHNHSARFPHFREGQRGPKGLHTCQRSQGPEPRCVVPKARYMNMHTARHTAIIRKPPYSLNPFVKMQTLPERGYPSLHGNPDCRRVY